jgi:lipopolysaccharide transport system permease protein
MLKYYEGRHGFSSISLSEIWRYRELIWAFGLRDLKVRYRQTVVGVAWAILQPVSTVLVFGILIHWLQGKPTTGNIPFIVTALCGMVPWQFFAAAVTQSTQSISSNTSIVKKVYFPRIILPLASFVPAAVDFLIAFAVLVGVMSMYGILPSWRIVFVPALVVVTLGCSLAYALWLSALNAIYRDIQYAVPFALQLGLIISPVVYESEAVVPAEWRALYFLNPLAIVIQLYRYALLDASLPTPLQMAISFCCMALLGWLGSFYFGRMERLFADRS